ncbi:MAG: hypothetical protein ACKVQB_04000 [Bacteroidia bacterium]
MKQKILLLIVAFYFSFPSFSQPIILPKLYTYKDTTTNYYLTFCEKYYSLFERHYGYDNFNYDTCKIDFEKYDLKGTKENDEIKWELVSPKKYTFLTYTSLPHFDTLQWKGFHQSTLMDNAAEYGELKKKMKYPPNDTFDFEKTILIYNDIFIDCNASFYYKIEYDIAKNTIICNFIELYGGCRGMKSEDSWITIDKPKPDTKIILRGFWIN